ncbi:MAG: hypothetical protein V4751_09165 [Pseudomonadota bacterium]
MTTLLSQFCRNHLNTVRTCLAGLALIAVPPLASTQSAEAGLEDTYRFLVSDREQAGGILYTATAGTLKGRQLPLSFVDSAAYWGEHVCRFPDTLCAVTDIFNPQTFELTPQQSAAGDLQTERINTHNGTNIYDAATWQIAVMLGAVVNRLPLPGNQDAYALASNQNLLLQEGHNGNSNHAVAGENRAQTGGEVFVYNEHTITEAGQAFTFRMLPRSWLAIDPFMGTRYAETITSQGLPADNADYQTGKVTWRDWKPITGENAWAFLLGPLQAAYLHYLVDQKKDFVPLDDPALRNALAILPTFAAMQSPSGGVYYAPAGTVGNQGAQSVNPYEVSVENNFSLYAGLIILRSTLQAVLAHDKNLAELEKIEVSEALQRIEAMINGGVVSGVVNGVAGENIGSNRTTEGLLAFFKNSAWQQGEFIQGGRADDPTASSKWIPNLQSRAVDVNTWGIAALGADQIDQWFGFGASFQNWQQVKQWGGYGVGKTLWGVGFSDQDGNGMDADGNFRQGVLSAEWTAGAITMVRTLIAYYQTISSGAPESARAQDFVAQLQQDEQSMLEAITQLRLDHYATAGFPGEPQDYSQLISLPTRPYLYASKRYFVPFGWNANPLPSTTSTAWMLMVANRFNPFVYGGGG